MYPDLLIPVDENTQLYIVPGELKSLWYDIDLNGCDISGTFPIKITLHDGYGYTYAATCFTIEIIPVELPESDFTVTQWFHGDCLSVYYNVDMFSEEHWRIIENFIKTAVKNGINMILTPTFTPPLDTAVGGERPTIQLVGVTRKDGKYTFNFDKLARWIEMCDRCGVKYFEIAHLFTQWGALHAPKIMAETENGYEKIFGWETDARSDEYTGFLRTYLTELLIFLKEKGVDNRCVYHVSDEPGLDQLEAYLAAKNLIADILKDYTIMDALSNYEFYESGAVDNPIPANNHIEMFIEHNVPNLWTYYCCGQAVDVSNRFVAMPSARTRIIGEQFYKFNIAGFLQWGYNFYFSQGSVSPINPYTCTDGEYFVPAGDAFSVYPAPDGTAYETLHLVAFTQALYDLRALKLCESLYSRDAVLAQIERGCPEPMTFKSYPKDADYILNLRERINSMIKNKI